MGLILGEGVTSSGAQELLLDSGSHMCAGDQIWVSNMHGKCLILCIISLAPKTGFL